MAACILHVCESKQKITNFSQKSWEKFISCSKKWSRLQDYDGMEKTVASEAVLRYNIELEDDAAVPPLPENSGYHRDCYQRYMCKSKIDRQFEKEHCKRDDTSSVGATVSNDGPNSDDEEASKPKKLLRSSIKEQGVQRTTHVFPRQCILCRKVKHIRNPVTRKSGIERLSQCETLKAGCLINAAKIKNDEVLLLCLQNVDPVAAEVCYHHSCYRAYTRFLQYPKSQQPHDTKYTPSFKKFCKDFVIPRILVKKEIFRLKNLTEIFKRFVRDTENMDASNYRTSKMKIRLKNEHPEIVFLKASKCTQSELVFVETLTSHDIIEEKFNLEEVMLKEMDTETETEDTADESAGPSFIEEPSTRDIFTAAMHLRDKIAEAPATFQQWPPTSSDFTEEAVQKCVPETLVKFIAWVVGISADPFFDIADDAAAKCMQKVNSICQDIVYLSTKGKRHLPKHLSLGMAVRHVTGSSSVIDLLNGYGHCVSNSIVLEHDTALAELQNSKGPISIPSCIKPNVFSTLVWDNNDFGEETLSGKGTSHNTNGIIVQRSDSEQDTDQPNNTASLPRTRKRSFEPPTTGIELFRGKKKQQPARFMEDALAADDTRSSVQESSRKLDFAYILTRTPCDKHDEVPLPTWTGFNTLLCKHVPQVSLIGYLPIIDASPTEMDTVFTVMQRSIDIANKLELNTIVVVFDQAIYAKAQTVRWQTELFLSRTVVRLGEFHTAMTFLACIGKRFGDGGLKDILIESEICAQGSLNGVISGHHYNRSVRCHKIIYETLQRLRWQAFISNLNEEEVDAAKQVQTSLHETFPANVFHTILDSKEFEDLLKKYRAFIEENDSNRTFRFWSSYIGMVEILLLFLRATREGDWNLHLAAVRSMLPWMFATNRVNYARYLPVYYLEMKSLPSTHPGVYQEFLRGEFVVQRQRRYGFAQVACDQAIEQTCNRDTKTKGGMVGITRNKGASYRWILSQPERASITNRCFEIAGKSRQNRSRKDTDQAHAIKEETAIFSVTQTIENFMDPFTETSENLTHIVSGVVVSDKIAGDIMAAEEKGELAFSEFCRNRLLGNVKGFHDCLKTLKLLSFHNVGLEVTTNVKNKEKVIKSERNLMARLVVIGKQRGISLEALLVHTLGPMPLSLAYPDGGLMRTNKSKLMHYLEDVTPSALVTAIPLDAVWILDAMAVLQMIPHSKIPPTFFELATLYLKMVANTANRNGTKRIHLVADCYPKVSVKNAERARRSKASSMNVSHTVHIYSNDQKVPRQWKKYLSCGENKVNLMEFFVESWSKDSRGLDLDLTVGHGDKCHQLIFQNNGTVPQMTLVKDLLCFHEEADTRLLCHALFATKTSEHVVIQSPDTDVLVLAVSKSKDLNCALYFETGTGNNRRVIDVVAIHEHLFSIHPSIPEALIGFHTFTGCDSVSGFFGKGKLKPFKLLLAETKFAELFVSIGASFELPLPGNVEKLAEEFVSLMYGRVSTDLNATRVDLFKTGKHMDDTLPPNLDSLNKHLLRANYQAGIHRRCLEANPNVPSPDGHGWTLEDGVLKINWMNLLPAPDAVLELTHCRCKKSRCKTDLCSCAKNKLDCTDFCQCLSCENINKHEATSLYEQEEEVEDSTSDEDYAE